MTSWREKRAVGFILIFVLILPQLSLNANPKLNNIPDLEIDQDRLLQRIEHLVAFGSRVSGSLGYNQSVAWIDSQLTQWGFETRKETVWIPNLEVYSDNLIALKPGNSSRIFGLSAHLDSISTRDDNSSAPGANDNGSGVGCLLELAYLIANMTFEDSIMFFFFTGEEQTFDGSRHWIENHPETLEQFTLFINLDMVGVGSRIEVDWHIDLYSSEYTSALISEAKDLAELPEFDSVGVNRFSSWVASDQRSFWDVGVGAVLMKSAQAHLYDHYHTSQDLPTRLNKSLLEDATNLILASLVVYGNGSYVDPQFIPIRIPTIVFIGALVILALSIPLAYRWLKKKSLATT